MLPLLSRALEISKSYACDVEVSVFFGEVLPAPPPNKKQAQQLLLSVSTSWGDFPFKHVEIAQLMGNFALLPVDTREALLLPVLALGGNENVDALEDTLHDLFLAMLLDGALPMPVPTHVFKAFQLRFLGLFSSTKKDVSPSWYFQDLLPRLAQRNVVLWMRVLRKLSPLQSSELLQALQTMNLTSPDSLVSAGMCCLFAPSPHAVQSLLFWLGKAADVVTKKEHLTTLVGLLKQQRVMVSPNEVRALDELVKLKSPAAELRPWLLLMQCWLLGCETTSYYELFLKEFGSKVGVYV
jgi:hypothetical protein